MWNPDKRQLILLTVLGAMAALSLVALAWVYWQPQASDLEAAREWMLSFLSEIPTPLYFLAFVLLPLVGGPLTFFYLTAIPVMGTQYPAIGIGLAWLAITLNMVIAKLLTRGIFLPVIEWAIRHRDMRIPRFRPDNEVQLVLAMRLSPVPFAVQNYLLALGQARWSTYLWLSLPIQGLIGLAVMLLGESVLRGGLGYVILALFLFLVLNLAFKRLRTRLKRVPPEPAN